ncbi:polyribonucleotide nucleotidyltransferase [bacterium]|nr:MAG: polyribonucleotide nucleotidyltransferase [bacterium]
MKISKNFGSQDLCIETGKIAKQANGSVMVTYGETVLLVTVTCSKKPSDNRSFFPLSVEYREKFYSSGRIPGGFFKREARPSEHEIIASRLTDRPLRPLFPSDFFHETQVLINVLSYDGSINPDILGTIGASTALSISDIPWDGPVASVRIGRDENGKFIINPNKEELETSDMEVIVSGTADSILMVEGSADFISEDDFISAVQYSHEVIKDIVQLQLDLVKKVGKDKLNYIKGEEMNPDLVKAIKSKIEGKIDPLNQPKNKASRYADVDIFVNDVVEDLSEEFPDDISEIKSYINNIISDDLREKTLDGSRADGRDSKTVRNIDIESSILPRTHGSCLFTRGETQAIVVTTLGNKRDEQMIDDLEGLSYRNLMLHYNFPPFSVGEVRRMFSVSRREIGHGNLALRAIKPSMPDNEDFPYTVRLVSEITESNGSSSMATVCGSTLALMDAGVPIKKPIAGIAMGLIMESKDRYAILTDILGTEDHLGDMDFKVAGSDEGITAIQMDLKIDGLPIDILKEALHQAKEGRLHILDEMNKCLSEPRKNMSIHAPKMLMTTVPVEKIGMVIGPQGKNIKALCAEYECELNVEEDGRCIVSGLNQEMLEAAIKVLEGYSFVPEVNKVYKGKVVKLMDFGAFVRIAPDVDGLVHISEIQHERTNKVEDFLKEGQEVDVKLIKKDDRGKLSLSIKALIEKK